MEIGRILVIADPNKNRDIALARAAELARVNGANIHMVGFCYDPLVDSGELPITFNREKTRRALLANTQENLDWLLEKTDLDGIEVTTETVWVKQLHEWVKAQQDHFDLVIKMGHRSEHLFYTPTDWHLFRTSPIPILIVSARRSRRRRHHILATVDLGSKRRAQKDLNEKVLDMAACMARVLGSELHIVYAIPISKILRELEVVEPRIEERRFKEKHAETLKMLAQRYDIPKRNIHLKAGDTHKVISGIARKSKAEMVVMGTIGRKGAKAAVMGNTAESVISTANTDMLVMRP